MMSDLEHLTEVPGIGRKLAEKMQRSASKVVADEEEQLRREAQKRLTEANGSELGLDGERQHLAQNFRQV